MQIQFQADLTHSGTTAVAVTGVDLSAAAGNPNVFFTLGKSGINYDVAAIVAPVTGGDGRWRVSLAAAYAGATLAGANCVLHLSFTSGGIAYAGPGDTEWPAISKRQAQTLDNRVITNDSRFDSITPEMVETGHAITVGVTDESTYIQAQLAAAAAAGKGIVKLDPRRYAISAGVINIPAFTSLQFASGAITQRLVAAYGGPGQTVTSPTAGGQFVMLGGSGGSDTAPAYVTLADSNASLVGAAFFDPDNPNTLTAPVAKPFAVRCATYGNRVESIEFVNAYRGIDVRGGETVVRNIFGNPLALGIRVDQSYDIARLLDCHFVNTFVYGSTLAGWFGANSVSFEFLDNDELYASRIFSFGYRIGLRFGASTVSGRTLHGTYGSLSDSGFDGGLYAIADYCTQNVGMLISNTSGSPTAGSSSRGYYAAAGKTGVTMFTNSSFWGSGTANVEIVSGAVSLRGCLFSPEDAHGVAVTGAANVDLTDGVFLNGGSAGTIYFAAAASASDGRIFGNRTISTGAPTDTIGVPAKMLRASASQLRALAASYPTVLWESSGNATDAKKCQSYADPAGNLVLATLNDAETASVPLLQLLRGGGLQIAERTALPPTPTSGVILWVDGTHKAYLRDSSGADHPLW